LLRRGGGGFAVISFLVGRPFAKFLPPFRRLPCLRVGEFYGKAASIVDVNLSDLVSCLQHSLDCDGKMTLERGDAPYAASNS